MDLPHLLKLMLVAELALLGIVVLVAAASWRRNAIARRVARHLDPAGPVGNAGSASRAAWALLVRFAMRDVTAAQAAVIPWLAGQLRFPPERAEQLFALARVTFAALGAASVYTFAGALAAGSSSAAVVQMVAGAAGAAGNWWLVQRFLRGWSANRSLQISQAMPYALDLILICLDSGAALETAIARVAEELAPRDPMVAEELRRTLMDINVIGNREQAFRNLGERIGTENMTAIVTVLSQSLQYGSSLSDALKGAIQNMKRTELLTLEERAGKLPVQLSLPGMALTFPQVIILLAGPGVLDLLDTFTRMQH